MNKWSCTSSGGGKTPPTDQCLGRSKGFVLAADPCAVTADDQKRPIKDPLTLNKTLNCFS